MVEYATVISPCISICTLDENRVCLGCKRTDEEIRTWYTLDNAGKAAIIEAVKQRNPGWTYEYDRK